MITQLGQPEALPKYPLELRSKYRVLNGLLIQPSVALQTILMLCPGSGNEDAMEHRGLCSALLDPPSSVLLCFQPPPCMELVSPLSSNLNPTRSARSRSLMSSTDHTVEKVSAFKHHAFQSHQTMRMTINGLRVGTLSLSIP